VTDNRELRVELGRDCVVVRPGYNGDRHRDPWVRHELPFGIVAYTYDDGEVISVQVPANQRRLETFAFQGWLPSSFETLPVGDPDPVDAVT
jgi:hypothetical protein